MKQNFDLARELREQSPQDWQFGALSQPGIISIPEAERENYLPVGETQFDAFTDFSDCASRSPVNHLEALFTYHYLHTMKPENKDWLLQQGYIQGGKVTFSDRFIAVLSGTTHNGNSLKSPVDTIRTKGLIPKKLLPKEDWMTWEDYYKPIPQNLLDLGQEFLKRFTISYEQVQQVHFADVLKDDMIGTAGYAWPVPVNGVYPKSPGFFNHAFLLYKLPKYNVYDNYQGYNSDTGTLSLGGFTKVLAPDYTLFDYGYRMYVSAEKVPVSLEEKTTLIVAVYKALSENGLLSLFAQWLTLFTQKVGAIGTKTFWQQVWEIVEAIFSYQQDPPYFPTITPANYLTAFCLAIKQHEGWYAGSRSQRNNNPGNCKYSSVGYLPMYGHVGKDDKNFAVFKDYATGFLYLQNLVKEKVHTHPLWDFYDFFSVYAPASDNNDTKLYAEVVAKACGVSPKMKVSSLF